MENRGTSTTKDEKLLSRMALNDNKAGMEGLDRDKINKIIMETSKGSRFYENELKREQQVNQRIEKMMLQKAQITEQQLQKAKAQVDRMALELESNRDLSRVIVHVDMDAFYAAVEMRDCPELKDKPMAVGSMSMLSTSNYHARKFGVRAAMPGFIAKKLCPSLVIVPPNFDKYRAVSEEIRGIFAHYDPNFQPLSLDEAYLDFTEHLVQRQNWSVSSRTHCYRSKTGAAEVKKSGPHEEAEGSELSPILFEDSPSFCGADAEGPFEVFGTSVEEAVREMRFRIEQKTTLTASAGIAPNMMLAKVCSDKNKPNGQYRLPPTREAVMDFVQNLPVRKVCGIGKVSEKMLKALGITSCSDLGQQMALLSLLFSETAWHHFMEISLGLSATNIPRHEERKSMSTERTFKELSKPEEQLSLCRELCEDLAEDLRKADLKGKTVSLKLKNVNFEVKTRAQTLPYAVATADDIFAVAKDLLKIEIENESPQPLRLRLMGVRIAAFVTSDDKAPMQKSIIGFLQPHVSQTTPQDLRKGPQCNTLLLSSNVPPQSGQKEEDGCCKQNQSAGEEPQQSFFKRAQAKRLQLQAANANIQHKGCVGDVQATTSSAQALVDNRAAPDLPEAQSAPPERTLASTSCSELDEGGFTCPVCFRRVETTDLNVFNRHIDRCLSDPAGKSGEGSDGEPGADPENNGKCEESLSMGVCLQEDQHSSRNRAVQKVPLIESDKEPARQSKSPVLTCPVCQLAQDTADLNMFNRHVDLCLNREVLHQLGGPATFPMNAPALQNGKTADGGYHLHRQAGRGKSKRRDPPSSPPSKKAKGVGPGNTIDKFFR